VAHAGLLVGVVIYRERSTTNDEIYTGLPTYTAGEKFRNTQRAQVLSENIFSEPEFDRRSKEVRVARKNRTYT